MYLVSLNLIGDEQGEDILFRDIGDVSVSFSNRGEDFAAEHPGTTDYQGSNIQAWCETFAQTHLSQAEYGALLPTHKSDEAATIPGLGIPLPGVSSGTVDFSPVTDILDGDKLFLLSAEEVTNPAYGFADGSARIAQFKGTPQGYWLRSPHIPTFPLDVGFVFSFGAVMDFPVNANFMFEQGTYARRPVIWTARKLRQQRCWQSTEKRQSGGSASGTGSTMNGCMTPPCPSGWRQWTWQKC